MATNSSGGIDPSEFYNNPDRANRNQFKLDDVDLVKSGEIADLIKSVKIFKHLDDNKLLDLAENFEIEKFQSGAHIVEVGKKADCEAGVYQTRKNDQTLHEISTLSQFDYPGGSSCRLKGHRKRPETAIKRHKTALIFTLFRRNPSARFTGRFFC
ncbi:unnamed protein product [Rotaria magnacalcarata]|uniref:Cyclic nucleotide-binding domain-containing protein n=1 Tax=Rotaria magnacalcarata TaxID=392030 RepID=A0A816UJP4_9BILA|nr:unnamed protein product [Rotaria magnacalcarata]